jgi:hypothetical protein
MDQAGMDDLKKVKSLWTRHGLLCTSSLRFVAVTLNVCGEKKSNVEMVTPAVIAEQQKT